jgi:hypothetical protein
VEPLGVHHGPACLLAILEKTVGIADLFVDALVANPGCIATVDQKKMDIGSPLTGMQNNPHVY